MHEGGSGCDVRPRVTSAKSLSSDAPLVRNTSNGRLITVTGPSYSIMLSGSSSTAPRRATSTSPAMRPSPNLRAATASASCRSAITRESIIRLSSPDSLSGNTSER